MNQSSQNRALSDNSFPIYFADIVFAIVPW